MSYMLLGVGVVLVALAVVAVVNYRRNRSYLELPMDEGSYKVIVVGRLWSNTGLERRATETLNLYSQAGWHVSHVSQGSGGPLILVLKREQTGAVDADAS